MILRTNSDWFEPVLIDAMFLRSIAMRCSPAASMVALAIICNLDNQGTTRLNVTELANFCQCDKGTVSRAIKELIPLNFCEAVPMSGGSLRLRVSSTFAERMNGGKKLRSPFNEEQWKKLDELTPEIIREVKKDE